VSDHADNESDKNNKLSALYRAGSTAQPPAHIDQAILARARRAVRPKPQRLRPSWAVPVSMAAVVVLSVSLISLIHKEAPTVSELSSDDSSSINYTEETGITENSTFSEQKNKVIAEKSIRTRSPAVTTRQESQKTVRKTEISGNPASPVAESINVPQNDPGTEQTAERQKIKSVNPSLPSPKSLAPAKTKRELTADTPTETSNKTTSKLFQRVSPQSESQLSAPDRITGDIAEFSPGLKKERYSEKNKSCELLSHSACLDSKVCSLMIDEQKVFVCRHSTNHCDTGFAQQADTKENCEAKNGCVYVSEPCFCPPDVVCVCSGGQPPQCRPRKN